MPVDLERREEVARPEPVLGDAIARNGVDRSAVQRTHMRELTTARQEAERRHARPASDARLDRPSQQAAARQRTVELRDELARIDTAHRAWLRDRGQDVPEPRARQDTVRGI